MLKKLKETWSRFLFNAIYKDKFGAVGANSMVYSPASIEGGEKIFIGENTVIGAGAVFKVLNASGGDPSALIIGDRVKIEPGVKFICQGKIIIRDDCQIYAQSTITNVPANNLQVEEDAKKKMILGRSIVVAPNSVVIGHVADYAVVGGVPATLISHFDTRSRKKT